MKKVSEIVDFFLDFGKHFESLYCYQELGLVERSGQG